MDNYILPATTYQPSPRQVRKHVLNTIIEDDLSEREEKQERDCRGRSQSPASRSGGSASPVPSLTSTISSYYRNPRRSRDFDDLYDVSDSETSSVDDPDTSKQDSSNSAGRGTKYPTLVIPSPRHWPTIQKLQKSTLVPPTPPPKIPISPAALSMLIQNHSTSTAPPSLDGSLTSDQIAISTAPPTPDTQSHADNGERWGIVEVAESIIDHYVNISRPTEIPEIAIQLNDDDQWDQAVVQFGQITPDTGTTPGVARPESPILGHADGGACIDTGVQLPANALDTLQKLSRQLSSEPSSVVDFDTPEEMQEVTTTSRRPKSVDITPASETSDYSFSQLSIPSPGGFFSSLGANARHTWCVSGSEPPSAAPPSSTTAERFYNAPWNIQPQVIVEQTLEIDDDNTEGPPTARQMPFFSLRAIDTSTNLLREPESDDTVQELNLDKKPKDFDEDYEKDIWQTAESNLDRTSVWLAAQTLYMESLRDTRANSDGSSTISRKLSKHAREDSLDSPMKKAVRFLDSDTTRLEGSKSSPRTRADPIFYQAFQHITNATSPTDSFIHRQDRFDALQVSRTSLPQEHVDHLLGNYRTFDTERPAPPRPISMMPGKGSNDPAEQTAEQRVFARVEKECQALDQVAAAMWIVEATRYLNGGRLLNGPVADFLTRSLSSGASKPEQARVLDLGGQPHCDWAWHCARDYSCAKVYTATSDNRSLDTHLRGPSNHRLVRVSHLWQLPFPDNHFDVISARSLFAFLKTEKPLGETTDEYDMCFRECLRCLKPGGFLEFFALDSEIVHSGPRGTAVSVEFGFNLRSRGYDPAPTKSWLGRLRRAGLVDIKRAWTFLPSGAPKQETHTFPETPPPHVSMYEDQIREAVQGPVGSSADVANVAGLVGSWVWEQWMLKLQMEMGKESLLEGVGAALQESKLTGAGWRCLSGWARKDGV